MIQPGLARISRLLEHSSLPWRAVHVAGTNGKGSVCAYVSAMLHAANIKTGRFTSPHLIDRWDSVTIEEKTIDESKFRKAEDAVKLRDSSGDIRASEFELLTATAFELFTQEKVQVGVIEVGVGGRYDATNIVQHPLVTVITKIGRDHQPLLGTSIEEIANHKAGIMKPGAACIVDATNSDSVLQVLGATAREVGAEPFHRSPSDSGQESADLQKYLAKSDLEPHQRINLGLAYRAALIAAQQVAPAVSSRALLEGARESVWPGRLQTLKIRALTGRGEPVILDGAHNTQSAEVLGFYVNERVRTKTGPITWIIAASLGKDLWELLSHLFQSHDNIVAVEFGPVDGMPWVLPVDAESILEVARSLGVDGLLANAGKDVLRSLQLAAKTATGDPIVICGSLYLVSDVLRLLRDIG
ncbi:MAG: hypothetical protein L6R42_000669 [Xanthoria sp. 1 TBL-2021]|nr:MAG: hypothetical protein L6R42_000669 [Xanthoria sp. 1 TBL-2021]